jgi:MFS transporter, DHA1 family, inner membrane transport protein
MLAPTYDTAEDEQPVRRAVIVVLATTAMLGAVNGVSLGPLMVEISRDLSTTPATLGQITALLLFGTTIVGLFAGPLADYYGPKRLLVIGFAVVATSAFTTMLAPSYGWLLASRLLSAVSGGLMAGTTMAVAGLLFSGPDRRKAIGTIAGGIALTPILGVPTLTFVASISSWRASYGLITILAIFWLLLVYRVLPDFSSRRAETFNVRQIVDAYQPLVRHRPMLLLYGTTLTRAMGFFAMVAYGAAYYGEVFGLGVREIGWTAMVSGISFFCGTKLVSGPVGRFDLRTVCGISTMFAAGTTGLAYTSPFGVMSVLALFAVASASAGIGTVALTTLVSSESPAGQSTTMSLNAAVFNLGGGGGTFLGGLLLGTVGYAALGAAAAAFYLAGAAIVWRPAWLRMPSYRTQISGD